MLDSDLFNSGSALMVCIAQMHLFFSICYPPLNNGTIGLPLRLSVPGLSWIQSRLSSSGLESIYLEIPAPVDMALSAADGS